MRESYLKIKKKERKIKEGSLTVLLPLGSSRRRDGSEEAAVPQAARQHRQEEG